MAGLRAAREMGITVISAKDVLETDIDHMGEYCFDFVIVDISVALWPCLTIC